jgi:hypothetical protein
MKTKKGQLLIGVIALLVVLAIVLPAMVRYIQNEAKWSVKQGQNTNAFQLAESAVDRAYQKIVESTSTWTAIKNGQPIFGYNFDTVYTDIAGGAYTVSITSGPGSQQVTIVTVGRDNAKHETRALKVVYANAAVASTAIRSLQGITLGGSNEQVEWGSVMAPAAVDSNARNHPQFYSASSIIGKDVSPAPPNTDSVQWWSYYTGLPPAYSLDFDFYKASAQATGTYSGVTQNWPAPCGDASSCNTGNTYYIDGDLNIASPGIFVGGNLIVTGNLNLPNGRAGQGSPTVQLPRSAWKQYGNDWAYYKAGGPACSESWNDSTPGRPVSFPGLNSAYLSGAALTKTFTDGKVLVNGFVYVGKNITSGGGGGQSVFVGAAYVVGSVSFTSNNNCFFYTDEAASRIVTTNVSLSRLSWLDSKQRWPEWLP